MLAALAALAVVGCSDTASAQPALTVSAGTSPTNPLVFNNIPSGGVSPSQTVTVTTGNGTTASVIIQSNPSSPWVTVSPGGSVNVPATLSVQCNTTNLSPGSYVGSFTITVGGAPSDFVTVYVSLSVTGASLLTASPSSLSFSAQAGASAATPSGIPVYIISNGQQLNYSIQAQTNNGGNWLLLSTTQGITGGAPFTVSVNPSGLTSTSYPAVLNGIITATSTTTLDTVQISVQLTLNATAELSVTPSTPSPFLYQSGTSTEPASQQLAISSAGGSLTFTIAESPTVSWLVLSALGGIAGNTPDLITMNATPVGQGLTPGTYTTNLIITPSGEPALAPIPITLVVASHPVIQLSTNTLSFSASFAGSTSPAQSVTLTASGAAVGFTVSSSASWLVANASSGTTPTTLTVLVNPTGLSIQNYTGTITITPTNGDTYTQTIAVSLTVNSASQLEAGPASLLFSYETGQPPPAAQTIELESTGQPLSFFASAATSTCGSSWLQAQPVSGSTNTTLTVSVVTAGLTPGTCSGTVTLNYNNGIGSTSLSIPVTLAVSSSAELSVSVAPPFGIATATELGSPFQQMISLTSTDPFTQVSYTAAVTGVSGGAWLGLVGSTSGTTPQNLELQYNPSAVSTPGPYTGTVQITSPSLGAGSFSLPVTLTVTSNTSVSVSPASLTFNEVQGGAAPASQVLTLTTFPGSATFTAVVASSTGGNWLQISPTSGNAAGPIQVGVVSNTLSPGTYTAQISFAFQGAATTSALVNVSLIVTAAQTLSASPASLGLSYQIGATAPAAIPLTISSSGNPVAITVSAASTGGWLSVSPTSGTTPLAINATLNPQGLSAQTYTGSISVSAPGIPTLSIPVSFTVTSPPAPQPIEILNNATGSAGVIAPGEELAIKGTGLGPSSPATGVLFTVNSSGAVSSSLAGVQVMFDNNPGTPIFVSAGQINVMVPYEINGRLSTNMVVLYNGVPSASFPLSVGLAAPGLFTNNFSGGGQVAAVNQDRSYNGTGSGFEAAPRGSVIALYGTGGGQTSPISVTGSVTPIPTSPSGLLNIPSVTATVGGLPATVEFAGEAPGLITGVFQINVLIPAGVAPGSAVPVTVSIDGIASPLGTTIAVQ